MTTSAPPKFPRLTRRALELEEAPISWLMTKALQVPGLLSLAAGFVDHPTLPHTGVAEVASRLLSDPVRGREALQYGTTAGDPRLRRALLDRLARGSDAAIWSRFDEDDLVLTGGSQQLLYLLGELLVEEGDLVLVENPSYFVYVGALQSLGARLVGVGVDRDGLIPESLERVLDEIDARGELARVKMLYTMPYYQNPTGATLSRERRGRVTAMLASYRERGLEAVILEDAAYRGLRFPGVEDLPPLFESQDDGLPVVYADSFSKILSPGMRVGYGILPVELREALLRLKSLHDFGSCHLAQQLVLGIMEDGLLTEHEQHLRSRYAEKCARLHDLLVEELGDRAEFIVPNGGLYLWMTLRSEVDTGMSGKLFQRALDDKVLFVPGEICGMAGAEGGETISRSMRLCYAYPSDRELTEAGLRLAHSIRSVVDAG